MKTETIEQLAIAEQFTHHARYAGVARQAVADGYSAIDAMFSAILIERDEQPPRNHKAKLDRVRTLCPIIFDERVKHYEHGGTSYSGAIAWDSVENFYREWLVSRYEAFEMTPGEARNRVAISLSAQQFVIQFLAEQDGSDADDLAEIISNSAYGYHYSETNKAVSMAHDHIFSEAEKFGEIRGSKLGTKMASATNFSDFDFIASDQITREIIEEDTEIASHAAKVYLGFVKLVEEIRFKRLTKLMDGDETPTKDQLNAAPDFMLSMKAKYHGQQLDEVGKELAASMMRSLSILSTDHNRDD